MNRQNWRTTVITLTTRLPFTFGLLVGDAKWAMGVTSAAHGNKWGDFRHRSRALVELGPERLMAAYLTWRGIILPRSLVPVARRAQQPLVPPPRPGTYGNAAVATMMAGGAREPQLLHLRPENRNHHHPPRPSRAQQQQPGPQMCALWHHRG